MNLSPINEFELPHSTFGSLNPIHSAFGSLNPIHSAFGSLNPIM